MKTGDIQVIKDYFSKKAGVELVYLYGSQAKKTAREDSDIDLAMYVTEDKNDLHLQLAAMSDLSTLLQKEVEIQVLNDCSITFVYRVISEGKTLFEKDENARVVFEEKVMRDYFDLKPFLDEYYTQLTRLARGGVIGARPFTH